MFVGAAVDVGMAMVGICEAETAVSACGLLRIQASDVIPKKQMVKQKRRMSSLHVVMTCYRFAILAHAHHCMVDPG